MAIRYDDRETALGEVPRWEPAIAPTLTFSVDGARLLAGDRLFDVDSGDLQSVPWTSRIQWNLRPDCAAVAAVGGAVAIGWSGGWLSVLEAGTGRLRFGVTARRREIIRVGFSPDGECVYAEFTRGDGRWYRIDTGRALRKAPCSHADVLLPLARMPIPIWHVDSGEPAVRDGCGVLSPDRQRLAVVQTPATLLVYRRVTARETGTARPG